MHRGGGRAVPWIVGCLLLIVSPFAAVAGTTLRVSTAVSLKPALVEAFERYRGEHPGTEFRINAGASAILLQQVLRGAPVDLLISASTGEIDRLVLERPECAKSRRALAGNRLVIVVPRGSRTPPDLAALTAGDFERIVIGNPRTAPVGRYARQALESLGLWDRLQERLVYAENARHALDFVARGEAAAGLVYRTDVGLRQDRVTLAAQIPERLHDAILYEGVVLAGSGREREATAFLEWLAGAAGRRVFERHGFRPVP